MCIMCALHKLFNQLLNNKVVPELKKRSTEGMFGSIPGRKPHEIIHVLYQAVEKSKVWHIPLYILKTDISAAFDSVYHSSVLIA